jgi:hypothetical protein
MAEVYADLTDAPQSSRDRPRASVQNQLKEPSYRERIVM